MRLKFLFFILACLFGLLPVSAWAQGIELKLQYQVQWGKFDIAVAEANWVFEENSVKMIGTSRTIGIAKKVRNFKGNSILSGVSASGNNYPLHLEISSTFGSQKKKANTTWHLKNGVIKTEREPEVDKNKVFPLRKKLIRGSIDPFTAMLNTIETIKKTGRCSGNHRVYDGLRTGILNFHDFGKQNLKKDRPFAFEGRGIKCGIISKLTGGHRINNRWRAKSKNKDDIVAYVSEVKPGIFIPVRIEVVTPIGKIIARLHMPSLSISTL